MFCRLVIKNPSRALRILSLSELIGSNGMSSMSLMDDLEGRSGLNGGRMWVSGFFYGVSVLSKSVTELAFRSFSFADVLHVTLIALEHVNKIRR